ncbi:hypothetical protein B4109_2512 [Geobacillus stearothermophilus]|nr:hypothetical protein B4109_2512 [Geobacillus stearothermophilus]KYD34140.1 hypothetical protein B4114_2576 [Geobacillus stearothermophilus]
MFECNHRFTFLPKAAERKKKTFLPAENRKVLCTIPSLISQSRPLCVNWHLFSARADGCRASLGTSLHLS